MGYEDILKLPPIVLLEWLNGEFTVNIPTEIATAEDMEEASKYLLKLTSYYSYLCSLLSYAKIKVRESKRTETKAVYEDMIDRRDAIDMVAKSVLQQYNAISRAVTIHIENNREIRM